MKINRNLIRYSRLLHIYLSIFLLLILLFFSITGIFLNHSNWFQGEPDETIRAVKYNGALPIKYIDSSMISDELKHFFTRELGVDIHHAEIDIDDNFLLIEQQNPGVSISVEIDIETGEAELIKTRRGIVPALNELHKGRHAKQLWLWLMDLSAVLIVIFSFSGLLILLPQKTRMRKVLFYSALGVPLILYAALY